MDTNSNLDSDIANQKIDNSDALFELTLDEMVNDFDDERTLEEEVHNIFKEKTSNIALVIILIRKNLLLKLMKIPMLNFPVYKKKQNYPSNNFLVCKFFLEFLS
jgi:hypothetical protein